MITVGPMIKKATYNSSLKKITITLKNLDSIDKTNLKIKFPDLSSANSYDVPLNGTIELMDPELDLYEGEEGEIQLVKTFSSTEVILDQTRIITETKTEKAL